MMDEALRSALEDARYDDALARLDEDVLGYIPSFDHLREAVLALAAGDLDLAFASVDLADRDVETTQAVARAVARRLGEGTWEQRVLAVVLTGEPSHELPHLHEDRDALHYVAARRCSAREHEVLDDCAAHNGSNVHLYSRPLFERIAAAARRRIEKKRWPFAYQTYCVAALLDDREDEARAQIRRIVGDHPKRTALMEAALARAKKKIRPREPRFALAARGHARPFGELEISSELATVGSERLVVGVRPGRWVVVAFDGGLVAHHAEQDCRLDEVTWSEHGYAGTVDGRRCIFDAADLCGPSVPVDDREWFTFVVRGEDRLASAIAIGLSREPVVTPRAVRC